MTKIRLRPLIGLANRFGFKTVPAGNGWWLIGRRASSWEARLARDKALSEHMIGEHVVALLAHYKVNCVIDAGANTGQYARMLRRHGFGGWILSYEPVTKFYQQIEAAANGDPKWKVYKLALGRTAGTSEIHVADSLSSIQEASSWGVSRYPKLGAAPSETIDVVRLDQVIEEALTGIENPRVYLKMDTQGYDLEVFAGAGEFAATLIGLQSEMALMKIYDSPGMEEALATYKEAGFSVSGMYMVTRQGRTGKLVEMDAVMVNDRAAKRVKRGGR